MDQYTDHPKISRHCKWVLFFSDFHFTTTYFPGSKNTKADDLSLTPHSTDIAEPNNLESCVIGAFYQTISKLRGTCPYSPFAQLS